MEREAEYLEKKLRDFARILDTPPRLNQQDQQPELTSLIFFREADAFEASEAAAPLPHNTKREATQIGTA